MENWSFLHVTFFENWPLYGQSLWKWLDPIYFWKHLRSGKSRMTGTGCRLEDTSISISQTDGQIGLSSFSPADSLFNRLARRNVGSSNKGWLNLWSRLAMAFISLTLITRIPAAISVNFNQSNFVTHAKIFGFIIKLMDTWDIFYKKISFVSYTLKSKI